jgi:hypothetical protein
LRNKCFSRFEYYIFCILYPFMTYLLSLPRRKHRFQVSLFCCVRICCRCNPLSRVVCRPLCSSGCLFLLNYTVIMSHYVRRKLLHSLLHRFDILFLIDYISPDLEIPSEVQVYESLRELKPALNYEVTVFIHQISGYSIVEPHERYFYSIPI